MMPKFCVYYWKKYSKANIFKCKVMKKWTFFMAMLEKYLKKKIPIIFPFLNYLQWCCIYVSTCFVSDLILSHASISDKIDFYT